MKIERYEKWFLVVTLVVLVGCMVAVVLSVTQHNVALPTPAGRIDPQAVTTTAPFTEPGLRPLGDNRYELVLIGRAWAWDGAYVTVPKGAEVTIIATSVDVIHGMRIPDTNVNVMVIPGQISQVDVTFDDTGTYTLLCHEYCGIGHQQMGATITVE